MVAFVVLAHTAPHQLARLVERLDPAQRPVWIHDLLDQHAHGHAA